jgi:pheromone a factor receptor
MIRLRRYRRDFARILELNHTNKSRFFRLFSMAMILILGILPVEVYVFIMNISIELHPYSWDKVHGDRWGEITLIPSSGVVIFDRWIRLAAGVLVFVFFGMGSDAWKMYHSWLVKLGLGRVFLGRDPNSTQPNDWMVGGLAKRAKRFARKISFNHNMSAVA